MCMQENESESDARQEIVYMLLETKY
jgi:hypothetical protein